MANWGPISSNESENIVVVNERKSQDVQNAIYESNKNVNSLLDPDNLLKILQEIEKGNPTAYDILLDSVSSSTINVTETQLKIYPDIENTFLCSEKLYFYIEPDELNLALNLLQDYWLINRNIDENNFIIKKELSNMIIDLVHW